MATEVHPAASPGARVAQLQTEVEQLYGDYRARQRAVDKAQSVVDSLAAQVELLGLTEAALTTLLAEVSAESLGLMESTITYGLRTVFDDRLLTFKFESSVQRGVPSVEPTLLEGEARGSVLESFGGGPGSLVAFLLRLLTVQRLGLYPLILLDESFSMVSSEYIENLAALLKELADKMGCTFLLVAHQPQWLDHATKAYRVEDVPGGVTFTEVA